MYECSKNQFRNEENLIFIVNKGLFLFGSYILTINRLLIKTHLPHNSNIESLMVLLTPNRKNELVESFYSLFDPGRLELQLLHLHYYGPLPWTCRAKISPLPLSINRRCRPPCSNVTEALVSP